MKFVIEGEEGCVLAIKNLGTWPEIAEIKRRKKRGQLFPKINLKY